MLVQVGLPHHVPSAAIHGTQIAVLAASPKILIAKKAGWRALKILESHTTSRIVALL
jgi:hypothetical protein